MEMSPNEIRNQQFSSSFRGYNTAEVDAFKESIAVALEEARAEIQKLTQQYETLSAKYNELKGLEDTIKTAVLQAQKNADQIIANARKESELIIDETKRQRDRAVDEKYRILSDLEGKIQKLEFTKKSFYTKLHSEVEAHLKLVDSAYKSETKSEPVEGTFKQETNPHSMGPSETTEYQEPEGEFEPEPEPIPEQTPKPEMVPEPTPEPERRSEDIRDETKPENQQENKNPEPTPPPEKPTPTPPSRPTLDMPDDEIDRVVDHFAEISQEEEKVTDGQPQGKDF